MDRKRKWVLFGSCGRFVGILPIVTGIIRLFFALFLIIYLATAENLLKKTVIVCWSLFAWLIIEGIFLDLFSATKFKWRNTADTQDDIIYIYDENYVCCRWCCCCTDIFCLGFFTPAFVSVVAQWTLLGFWAVLHCFPCWLVGYFRFAKHHKKKNALDTWVDIDEPNSSRMPVIMEPGMGTAQFNQHSTTLSQASMSRNMSSSHRESFTSLPAMECSGNLHWSSSGDETRTAQINYGYSPSNLRRDERFEAHPSSAFSQVTSMEEKRSTEPRYTFTTFLGDRIPVEGRKRVENKHPITRKDSKSNQKVISPQNRKDSMCFVNEITCESDA